MYECENFDFWRKRMTFKRIFAVIAAICLSFTVSGLFPLVAPATDGAETESVSATGSADSGSTDVDVIYDASDAYKSVKYYGNLINLTKSGDQAVDTVAIALSQVGYHEGNGEEDFGGLNAEGNRDFVEYNLLFGKLDNSQGNGVSYGYSWCASFITWCLRHAGVAEEQSAQVDPKTYRSCWQWQRALEDANAFHDAGDGYKPELGDLVFFKNVDDSSIKVSSSHVGLVLFVDGEKVYTVEGNTNSALGAEGDFDCVAVKSYPLDSKYIVGYGCPDYTDSEESKIAGWVVASGTSGTPKPLSSLFDEMRRGETVAPVIARKGEVGVFEIVAVSLVAAGMIAAITVLAVMTFKKKPDDRNSGRRKESKKSRNKYSGSNKLKRK